MNIQDLRVETEREMGREGEEEEKYN